MIELVVAIFPRALMLVGVAALLAVALRQAPAIARRGIWTLLLVALLAAPVLTHFVPRVAVEVRPVELAMETEPEPPTTTAAAGLIAFVPPADPPMESGRSLWTIAILGLWALGVVTRTTRWIMDARWLRRMRRRTTPLVDGNAARIADRLIAESGVRRRIRVVSSLDLSVPAAWGVLRPIVALPIEAETWSPSRIEAVLRHELAHVRAMDYAILQIDRLTRLLYWPNPLVHWASRRLRTEQERACDEAVLGAGIGSTDYARLLVSVASSSRGGPTLARAALSMGHRDGLADRVRAIIGYRVSRRCRVATIVAGVCLLTLAPLVAGLHVESRHEASARVSRLALRSVDAGERGAAAKTLGLLGDPSAVEPLRGLLDDPDDRVRLEAVTSLGRIAHRSAFYDLEPLVAAPDPTTRAAAVWSLGEIQCFPAIRRLSDIATNDPVPAVRTLAVEGLAGAPAALASDALRRAARDSDPTVRHAAVTTLGALAFGAPAFERALAREAPRVQRATGHLIASNDSDAARSALLGSLDDPEAAVRDAARFSIAMIDRGGP